MSLLGPNDRTKLVAFRVKPDEKARIDTMAQLHGINTTDIFRNYALALLAGEAELYPPRGEVVAYK